jgi:hypothetical protein
MDALTPLAAGLWVATRPLVLFTGDVGTRMTVVRLRDGGLWLHSPVRLDAPTRTALDAIGAVRAVVAPSLVHHFFVGDYAAAYPEARVFAAPGLGRKRSDLRIDETLGEQAPALWAGQLEQELFGAAPLMNEVVFFHPPTRTLVLTDLAFNIVRPAVSRRARLFFWLVGARGLTPHRGVKLITRDRAAARRSIDRILQWDFDRITVTHGDVMEHGGHAAFEAAFRWLP